MAVAYNPSVVTSEMVVCLDAANLKSYSGQGATWDDISGRGNHGSIKSGLTFAPSGIKNFTFDLNSSNERIEIAHSEDLNYSYLNWAYNLWMKINFDDNGTWTQLFMKGNDNGNRRPGVWFYSGATSRFHFIWNATGSSQQTLNSTDPITTPIGVWANWVFQSRGGTMMIFKNGVKDSQELAIADRNTNTEPLHIGGYNYRSPGIELGYFSVYKRSLSDAEIIQNYNALRGRFGV